MGFWPQLSPEQIHQPPEAVRTIPSISSLQKSPLLLRSHQVFTFQPGRSSRSSFFWTNFTTIKNGVWIQIYPNPILIHFTNHTIWSWIKNHWTLLAVVHLRHWVPPWCHLDPGWRHIARCSHSLPASGRHPADISRPRGWGNSRWFLWFYDVSIELWCFLSWYQWE